MVDEPDLRELIGRPRFTSETAERTAVPGVATGLAVTGMGGDVLFIEANAVKGSIAENTSLTLTGQLGDVMKESAQIALSYVRSHAGRDRDRAGDPGPADSTCTSRPAASPRTDRRRASRW